VTLWAALERGGWRARLLWPGKGEPAWGEAMTARVIETAASAAVAVGVGAPLATPGGLPTLAIDRRPIDVAAPGVVAISGASWQPSPSTSSMAYWLAQSIGDVRGFDWVAALGAMAALGDRVALPLVVDAKRAHGANWLREALLLLRAAQRAAAPETAAAATLLRRARDPQDFVTGARPARDRLLAARAEVEAAIEAVRAVEPVAVEPMTLLRVASPCHVQAVLARIWANRRPEAPALVGNDGYLPGRVAFAAEGADAGWQERFRSAMPGSAVLESDGGDADALGGHVAAADWRALLARLGSPAAAWGR
jgi:single-stranded-DNA-specific exonuclease